MHPIMQHVKLPIKIVRVAILKHDIQLGYKVTQSLVRTIAEKSTFAKLSSCQSLKISFYCGCRILVSK